MSAFAFSEERPRPSLQLPASPLFLAWKMLGSPTQATVYIVYIMLSLAGIIGVAAGYPLDANRAGDHLNILDLAQTQRQTHK